MVNKTVKNKTAIIVILIGFSTKKKYKIKLKFKVFQIKFKEFTINNIEIDLL